LGYTASNAKKEIELSIDRLVYYAGWADKYQQLHSSVNPVASSHFNFSVPEPMGVVAIMADESTALLGLISVIAPCIVGGNTCIILASENKPTCAITFAEVLATSDVPAGVVNILTGTRKELHTHFSSHMDVNAVINSNTEKEFNKTIGENASLNVKRVFAWNKNWNDEKEQGPYFITDLQEIKTTWHPIENIGVSGIKY
jgi:acyl-CoA reductase-like NAD-dependent aldehyde dehydrogenase